MPGNYYVYLMASPSKTLYIGITNDLVRRVSEHRTKAIAGFTARYNCTRLVHYEWFPAWTTPSVAKSN